MERNKKFTIQQKRMTTSMVQLLTRNIILNQNNLRLTFDVPVTNYQNPTVTRPKIIAQSSKITRIKNIWIAYWCPRTNNVIYGRIVEKNHFYNHHQIITFEHFIHIPDSHPYSHNQTSRSRPTYLTRCTGCHLSEHNIYNNTPTNNCYITSLSNSTFIINVSKSNLTFQNYRKPFYKCAKQHSTIKQIAIIDFNLRSSRPTPSNTNSEDPIIYRSHLQQSIDLNSVNFLNRNLIIQLVQPNSLHIPLLNLSLQLNSYTNLDFYTDGSLVRDNDIPTMGYGWIFTSDLTTNITHSGASCEWASLTKAELLAIITALIVCPPNSTITIYTDSNNCINTFNNLQSPKLTTRRFQKINNCTLWNTLKHIISTLKLSVSLIKVKVHSGDALNDAAECRYAYQNIRKSIKRIINFQYFEQHLAHQNLHKIKQYALNKNIDWEYFQLWFKYNSFSKPTSKQYSKHISWRIKCSSNNLPMLDILNRNYPDLLNNHDSCFLCSTNKESNEHLWNCLRVLSLITPIFIDHYNKFKTLITSESNSVYALYSDSIMRNPIFKWTTKPPQQIFDIPDLHCLLMNFVPISLTYPFKAAKINKNTTKRILLKFLYDLHKDIYEQIWKVRANIWKDFKKANNITKKSFIDYRRNHNHDSTHTQHNIQRNNNIERSNGYHCSLNDTRRHIENNNLWIYLTSSNFLHNLPWLSSLNEDLSKFHSTIFDNIFLSHI
ncbi:hypothetical protein RhiirA4_475331 [Rhizophagus irregularis]|uniref:RNase H type-1 domain-containing protein n=1 Tax=Rhizophagus irregularis TaxID=588596 RepID=A0A2I1HA12_9GLOM|nr:hypothetical protein RhiirA4_475331 [Rhizophagus irregularis]